MTEPKRQMRLVEVAVVVFIVVIAYFLFVPRIGPGPRGPITSCMSTARGIGQAIAAYMTTSDDILPPGKYSTQWGHGVEKSWMELLYEGNYIDSKEAFQCPADDVTDNAAVYYDPGTAYPDWWASYSLTMNCTDLFVKDHEPVRARIAAHRGLMDTQILLGESEANFIQGSWFGWGDDASFMEVYLDQFPFRRHRGKCPYVMLDGHAIGAVLPVSKKKPAKEFRKEISDQFEKCDGEQFAAEHVCFWNRYATGLAVTDHGKGKSFGDIDSAPDPPAKPKDKADE